MHYTKDRERKVIYTLIDNIFINHLAFPVFGVVHVVHRIKSSYDSMHI